MGFALLARRGWRGCVGVLETLWLLLLEGAKEEVGGACRGSVR
jgi:hypothetical protein